MITAKVIEDSITKAGVRLSTLSLEYHNYIHTEVLTHRDKSRNAHSNRAIPGKKLRKWVLDDMATPIHWGSNRPGMVAGEEITGWRRWAAKKLWRLLGTVSVAGAWGLESLGVHKQVSNRVLGPYINTRVIISGTDWVNMLALRDAGDAQPEVRALAVAIRDALNGSEPHLIMPGEWHLPYVSLNERIEASLEDCKKFSVARCARVSYLTHEGKEPNPVKDRELFQRLLESGHMSPFEHQATPAEHERARSGNFVGWVQNRKTLPCEVRSRYDLLHVWNVLLTHGDNGLDACVYKTVGH